MNKFEINVEKANEILGDVWSYHTGITPHDNFLTGWAERKEEYLSDIFGGELILKKEVEVQQCYETMKRELENLSVKITNAIEREEWYKQQYSWMLYSELRTIFSDKNLYDNKVTRTVDYGDRRKLQEGEKLTRCLKKLISDKVKVDSLQTEYSKIVNQKTLKGDLCLSIHPLDFLTMSYTSTWSSCFNVFNHGEYRAGALELACSNNTICAYLTSKDLEIEGKYTWNDKKWRAIVTVEPDECIMTGKNYPYQSEELTRLVYEWVAELCKEKYGEFDKWEDVKEGDDTEYRVSLEFGYNDFNHGAKYYFIGENKEKATGSETITYGSIPCPECGEKNHFIGESIVCENCDGSFYCECCGEHNTGDVYTVMNGGYEEQVCYCCYDDYYRDCESCGESHHYENMYTDAGGNYYCDSCRDEKLTYCERCEELHHNDDIKELNNAFYCDWCYNTELDEIAAEEEVKEKEEKDKE